MTVRRRLDIILVQDGKDILFALLCKCKLPQVFMQRKWFPGQKLDARCHGPCWMATVKIPQLGALVVIGITTWLSLQRFTIFLHAPSSFCTSQISELKVDMLGITTLAYLKFSMVALISVIFPMIEVFLLLTYLLGVVGLGVRGVVSGAFPLPFSSW